MISPPRESDWMAMVERLGVEPALARDPQNFDRIRRLAEPYRTLGQYERANQLHRPLDALNDKNPSSP